jgi:hypothetical protein
VSVRWTRNGAAAAIAGFAGFALGFTGAVSVTISLFAFAVLCGLTTPPLRGFSERITRTGEVRRLPVCLVRRNAPS